MWILLREKIPVEASPPIMAEYLSYKGDESGTELLYNHLTGTYNLPYQRDKVGYMYE